MRDKKKPPAFWGALAMARREITDGCHALRFPSQKPTAKQELLTTLIHNYGHTTT